jgi:hypothetical protein
VIHAEQWRVGLRLSCITAAGPQRLRVKLRQARADFEAARKDYPACTESDFTEYCRQRAITTWKYAMRRPGARER